MIKCIMNNSGIVISIIALVVSTLSLQFQREHNKNSVRPIIDILVGDYEDRIFVKVKNNGVGPAIIKKVIYSYDGGFKLTKEYTALYKLLGDPNLPTNEIRSYNDYIEEIIGRGISQNSSVLLIDIGGNLLDIRKQRSLRQVLKDITVEVIFQDIYGQTFSSERKLSFFGRNL